MITDAIRAQVVDLVRQGTARNEIARQLDLGKSTVSRIAAAAGVGFDRQQTAQATQAKQIDQHAARTERAAALLAALDRAHSFMATAEDAREFRDAAMGARALADAHARLATVPKQDTSMDEGRSMLTDLRDALAAAFATRTTTTGEGG